MTKNTTPTPPEEPTEITAGDPEPTNTVDTDPIVGDTYLDLDDRTENRRIHIESVDGDEFVGMDPVRRYRYTTVSNDANEKTIGRAGHVNAHTLATRYRKVNRS